MTKEDVVKYEYCKKHLDFLETIKEKMPFKQQKYGCGGGRPNIEYTLEKTHNEMYSEIIESIAKTRKVIEKIIEEI